MSAQVEKRSDLDLVELYKLCSKIAMLLPEKYRVIASPMVYGIDKEIVLPSPEEVIPLSIFVKHRAFVDILPLEYAKVFFLAHSHPKLFLLSRVDSEVINKFADYFEHMFRVYGHPIGASLVLKERRDSFLARISGRCLTPVFTAYGVNYIGWGRTKILGETPRHVYIYMPGPLGEPMIYKVKKIIELPIGTIGVREEWIHEKHFREYAEALGLEPEMHSLDVLEKVFSFYQKVHSRAPLSLEEERALVRLAEKGHFGWHTTTHLRHPETIREFVKELILSELREGKIWEPIERAYVFATEEGRPDIAEIVLDLYKYYAKPSPLEALFTVKLLKDFWKGNILQWLQQVKPELYQELVKLAEEGRREVEKWNIEALRKYEEVLSKLQQLKKLLEPYGVEVIWDIYETEDRYGRKKFEVTAWVKFKKWLERPKFEEALKILKQFKFKFVPVDKIWYYRYEIEPPEKD